MPSSPETGVVSAPSRSTAAAVKILAVEPGSFASTSAAISAPVRPVAVSVRSEAIASSSPVRHVEHHDVATLGLMLLHRATQLALDDALQRRRRW